MSGDTLENRLAGGDDIDGAVNIGRVGEEPKRTAIDHKMDFRGKAKTVGDVVDALIQGRSEGVHIAQLHDDIHVSLNPGTAPATVKVRTAKPAVPFSRASLASFDDMPPSADKMVLGILNAVLMEEKDVCIAITGDTGSGKTTMANRLAEGICNTLGCSEELARKFKAANGLLECIGNAALLSNPTSSRFGLATKIQVCPERDEILAFEFETSSIELPRAYRTRSNPAESNFFALEALAAVACQSHPDALNHLSHDMSQLLAKDLANLELEGHKQLRVVSCLYDQKIRRRFVDRYFEMRQYALAVMDEDEWEQLLVLLAIIIHLGQVTYKDIADLRAELDSQAAPIVPTPDGGKNPLKTALRLMGNDRSDSLRQVMLSFTGKLVETDNGRGGKGNGREGDSVHMSADLDCKDGPYGPESSSKWQRAIDRTICAVYMTLFQGVIQAAYEICDDLTGINHRTILLATQPGTEDLSENVAAGCSDNGPYQLCVQHTNLGLRSLAAEVTLAAIESNIKTSVMTRLKYEDLDVWMKELHRAQLESTLVAPPSIPTLIADMPLDAIPIDMNESFFHHDLAFTGVELDFVREYTTLSGVFSPDLEMNTYSHSLINHARSLYDGTAKRLRDTDKVQLVHCVRANDDSLHGFPSLLALDRQMGEYELQAVMDQNRLDSIFAGGTLLVMDDFYTKYGILIKAESASESDIAETVANFLSDYCNANDTLSGPFQEHFRLTTATVCLTPQLHSELDHTLHGQLSARANDLSEPESPERPQLGPSRFGHGFGTGRLHDANRSLEHDLAQARIQAQEAEQQHVEKYGKVCLSLKETESSLKGTQSLLDAERTSHLREQQKRKTVEADLLVQKKRFKVIEGKYLALNAKIADDRSSMQRKIEDGLVQRQRLSDKLVIRNREIGETDDKLKAIERFYQKRAKDALIARIHSLQPEVEQGLDRDAASQFDEIYTMMIKLGYNSDAALAAYVSACKTIFDSCCPILQALPTLAIIQRMLPLVIKTARRHSVLDEVVKQLDGLFEYGSAAFARRMGKTMYYTSICGLSNKDADGMWPSEAKDRRDKIPDPWMDGGEHAKDIYAGGILARLEEFVGYARLVKDVNNLVRAPFKEFIALCKRDEGKFVHLQWAVLVEGLKERASKDHLYTYFLAAANGEPSAAA